MSVKSIIGVFLLSALVLVAVGCASIDRSLPNATTDGSILVPLDTLVTAAANIPNLTNVVIPTEDESLAYLTANSLVKLVCMYDSGEIVVRSAYFRGIETEGAVHYLRFRLVGEPAQGDSGCPVVQEVAGKVVEHGALAFAFGYTLGEEPQIFYAPLASQMVTDATKAMPLDAAEPLALGMAPEEVDLDEVIARYVRKFCGSKGKRQMFLPIVKFATPDGSLSLDEACSTNDIRAAANWHARPNDFHAAAIPQVAEASVKPGELIYVSFIRGTDVNIGYSCVVSLFINQDTFVACGHPVTYGGALELPFWRARATAVISNIVASFKLVEIIQQLPSGKIGWDGTTGIKGKVGSLPSPLVILTAVTDKRPWGVIEKNWGAHEAGYLAKGSYDFAVGVGLGAAMPIRRIRGCACGGTFSMFVEVSVEGELAPRRVEIPTMSLNTDITAAVFQVAYQTAATAWLAGLKPVGTVRVAVSAAALGDTPETPTMFGPSDTELLEMFGHTGR